MQPLKEVRYHKAEVLTQICKRINRHNPIIEKFGMGRNKSLSVRMKSHREPFSFISRTKMLFIGKWRSAAIGRFGRLALGGPANESSWLAAAATGQEKGSPNNKGEKQIRAFRSIPSAAEETLFKKVAPAKSATSFVGSCIAQRLHHCFSPSGPGFDSWHSQKFITMLLRFINSAG